MKGLRNLPAAAAVAAALVICGCGPSMSVKVGGMETSVQEFMGPVRTGTPGLPQLSFCVTKGTISNTFRSRNASVRDDAYYQAHVAEFLKGGAPFASIEAVSDDVAGRECDVVLAPYTFIYVTPLGTVEATLSVAAVAADRESAPDSKTGAAVHRPADSPLMSVYVPDERSVEAAGKKAGRAVYNAFVPGSPLYNRVAAAKGAAAEGFEAVAKRYRDAAVKPVLPESARRYQVQAEAAVRRKEFDEAAARYLDALKIAPWWPEGYFNRALLLGETGRYRAAIGEMKKYLSLVPDAPDARSAQDKIYEWEGLAGRPN